MARRDSRQWTWITPDGEEMPLDGENASGMWVLDGVTGLSLPVYTKDMQARPNAPGSLGGKVRAASRNIFLPLEISAKSRAQYLRNRQQWGYAISPLRGVGKLRIVDQGVTYEIDAQYTGGMEGDDSWAVTGVSGTLHYGRVGINFDCPNVYFRIPQVVRTVFYGSPISADSQFFPIPPLSVARSQIVGGGVVLNNSGTADSPVVWTATGPFTSISLANPETGESIAAVANVARGDKVVIDTSVPSITTLSGRNLFPLLSSDDFWPIRPGDNTVEMLLTGTDQDSSLMAEFYPQLEALD